MIVFIMAGGLGKRMESDLPKVCHCVGGIPMIEHVVSTALQLNPEAIYIIAGKYKSIIENIVGDRVQWIIQDEPLGTGHAVKCGLDVLKMYPNTKTLILSGDVPLISHSTLLQLVDGDTDKILVTELPDPTGCGRIIMNADNKIAKIVEEKDCTPDERSVKLVNCGIYQINSDTLVRVLPLLSNDNQAREYYLTDIVQEPFDYVMLPPHRHYEIKNVNTKKDLEELNA